MQANFQYEPAQDGAGCQLGVTVLADRAHVRGELRDDAEAAGFRILHSCSLAEYAQGELTALGDLVLIDCAEDSGEALALLSRLDMRAGKAGSALVVSTTMAALDAVFGCFSFSAPQILVDPSRSERVIAIGRVLAHVPNLRLRELGEEDRLMLLRLTEQVGRIAERLEKLPSGQRAGGGAFRLESPAPAWRSDGPGEGGSERPRLPHASIIRRAIKHRHARARFFDPDLFADPAWDILRLIKPALEEAIQRILNQKQYESFTPPPSTTSSSLWQDFAQHTTDGLVFLDRRGMVMEWNQGMQVIVNLSREEVIGKPFWDMVTTVYSTSPDIATKILHLKESYSHLDYSFLS